MSTSMSVIDAIQTESYLKAKEDFKHRIVEAETRDAPHDSASAEQNSSPDESQEGQRIDETRIEVPLKMLQMIFRMTQRDLNKQLDSEELDASDRVVLEKEKEEVTQLLDRASKIQNVESEASKTPKLNFHRDIKDRYRGGKK